MSTVATMAVMMTVYLVVRLAWGITAAWLDQEPKVKSVEPTEPPYMCPMYEIRLLENKLVDAGIIKEHEVSICDTTKCDDCRPTRRIQASRLEVTQVNEQPATFQLYRGDQGLYLEEVQHDYCDDVYIDPKLEHAVINPSLKGRYRTGPNDIDEYKYYDDGEVVRDGGGNIIWRYPRPPSFEYTTIKK